MPPALIDKNFIMLNFFFEIEGMATFTALLKVYSIKFFTTIAGFGIQREFSRIQYIIIIVHTNNGY